MYSPQPILNTNQVDEAFWSSIREQIIGSNNKQVVYADWTASGRLYRPIEQRISEVAGAYMANTHTEDSFSGAQMTAWLTQAINTIRQHVNANAADRVLSVGNGMTGALAKLIRILGWQVHERYRSLALSSLDQQPLVYLTHREHHSNQTAWLESLAEVRIIPALAGDHIDLDWLEQDLKRENNRPVKIASITAASNVTGILTPYRQIAALMHAVGGWCFVDFAASAPYVNIDMHPNEDEWLDAIFFSPHKFLGGPGSNGVLVFSSSLYNKKVPDEPGGGTVLWTNPWGEHRYSNDIETRETSGTPGILQTLKTALAVQLKEEMGVDRIQQRERSLNEYFFQRLSRIGSLQVLSAEHQQRLSIFSVLSDRRDYRDIVRALSRHYRIETRGGCACAGTYGHHLLNIDTCQSHAITSLIDQNPTYHKPGWVRISLHPSMEIAELDLIADALEDILASTTRRSAFWQTPPNLWARLSAN